jgi:hypothetical protein
LDLARVREAYRDNLRWVLEDVTERLLPGVSGTVALSADHGNAMGEWGVWAHPPAAVVPSVRKVPWATVEGGDRTIQVGARRPSGDAQLDDQLAALGYK